VSVSQSVSQPVSQYILVSSRLCGCLTRYCFLFKSLGLEFVVMSQWGALSDERPGLSFVSPSVVICLCVHLLLTFLSFTHGEILTCRNHPLRNPLLSDYVKYITIVKLCCCDRLCGLVARVHGYRSRGLCSIPGAIRFPKNYDGVHSAS
jgi:hypothetical protein